MQNKFRQVSWTAILLVVLGGFVAVGLWLKSIVQTFEGEYILALINLVLAIVICIFGIQYCDRLLKK